MRARQARRVLRVDAILDVALGAFLLLAAWDGLYRAVGLPSPEPAIFAELGGVLLFGFAYLLWVAPDYAVLARRVAEAAALGNGLAAALIALWLAGRPPDVHVLGWVVMGGLTATFAVLAWLEARIAAL
jgi:hypothetical protein